MYDIYGKEGLASGLQVGSKLQSREELRAQWERFQAQRVRVTQSPSLKLHCSATGVAPDPVHHKPGPQPGHTLRERRLYGP